MHQPNNLTTSTNFHSFQLPQSSASTTHFQTTTLSPQHNLKCSAVVQLMPNCHSTTAMANQQQSIPSSGQLHLISFRPVIDNGAKFLDSNSCQPGSSTFAAAFVPANLIHSGQHSHPHGPNPPTFLGINDCLPLPQTFSQLPPLPPPPPNIFIQPPSASTAHSNFLPQTFLPPSTAAAVLHKLAHPVMAVHHHQQHIVTTPNKKCRPPSLDGAGDWTTAVTGWEQAAMIKNKIGLLVNNRFRIMQSIASGSYACRDNHLRYEYLVYKSVLYEDGNGKVEGFPQIMVMELLGAPVASLFAFCNRRFARQTIVSLGEQMIHRIRHLHQRGFIHRDIKPENFLMGLPPGKESTLYLIDFGLARRYRFREGENRTLTHIPFRRGRSFIGTAKYASLNSHKNIELSRRDDLESLAYVLIELVNGHLPWKNISKRNATTRHQASQRIRQLKEQTSWEEFCPCLAKFIRYCREIHFGDEPNYDKLLDMLQSVLIPELSVFPAPSVPVCKTVECSTGDVSTKSNNKTSTKTCCQTLKTAEKTTQMSVTTTSDETMSAMAQSMQNFAITTTAVENTNAVSSDYDELGGAATTTTSCSENELDPSGRVSRSRPTIRSGTGTADDEDSQPTPQQEQHQVCRKCRRLRDQTHQQQQQKRVKDQQIYHLKQKKPQQRIDTALQTDLGNDYNFVGLGRQFKRSSTLPPEQRRMCWQNARESNPERRFQYENKFSWTLPINAEQQLLFTQPSGIHPAVQIISPSAAALLPISPLKAPTIAQFTASAAGSRTTTIPFGVPTNALIQNQQAAVIQQHNPFTHPPLPLTKQSNINCQKHFSDEMQNLLQKQGTPLQVAFVLPPPTLAATTISDQIGTSAP
uniref:non-specific serine/threonine protein kinase n=1 Tax=Meloidogyne javanica TaxID=6303 RepID=A0A915NCF5_MELJA